jgi:hypothetical protein
VGGGDQGGSEEAGGLWQCPEQSFNLLMLRSSSTNVPKPMTGCRIQTPHATSGRSDGRTHEPPESSVPGSSGGAVLVRYIRTFNDLMPRRIQKVFEDNGQRGITCEPPESTIPGRSGVVLLRRQTRHDAAKVLTE